MSVRVTDLGILWIGDDLGVLRFEIEGKRGVWNLGFGKLGFDYGSLGWAWVFVLAGALVVLTVCERGCVKGFWVLEEGYGFSGCEGNA